MICDVNISYSIVKFHICRWPPTGFIAKSLDDRNDVIEKKNYLFRFTDE